MLEKKKSFVHRTHFKTLSKQQEFQSFLELKIWFENLELSKTGAASHRPLPLYTHSKMHFWHPFEKSWNPFEAANAKKILMASK
jgi:hypothetical protein